MNIEDSKKQQLELWLDHVYWIWFSARLYYSYLLRLNDDKNSSPGSVHKSTIRYACFGMLILECSKLFSDSSGHKYNFFRLVETTKEGAKFHDLLKDQAEKLLWLEANLFGYQEVFDRIEILRNKSYAHFDMIQVPELSPQFKEHLLKLLNLGYEIIRCIGSGIDKDYYYGEVHYELDDFNFTT